MPRPNDDENTPPTIDISWADSKISIINPNVEMIMIEARSGFYENVRHSMRGLQHAAGER